MTEPGIFDFSEMRFDDQLGFAQLSLVQTGGNCQVHHWRQPELGFAVRMGHMHTDTRLFTGEEKKAKLTLRSTVGAMR